MARDDRPCVFVAMIVIAGIVCNRENRPILELQISHSNSFNNLSIIANHPACHPDEGGT